MYSIDDSAKALWLTNPEGFAYYLAGYLNATLDYTLPALSLGGITTGYAFPADDPTEWRYLHMRPSWPVAQFNVDSFHSVISTIDVTLGRHLRQQLIKHGRVVKYTSLADGIASLPMSQYESATVFGSLDSLDEFPSAWRARHDYLDQAKRIVEPGEFIVADTDAGTFAMEPVRIGNPPGMVSFPNIPMRTHRSGVEYLTMPIITRWRMSISPSELALLQREGAK